MKTVFQFLAVASFIGMFAAIGGMDHGSLGLFVGGIYATAFLGLSALFAKLGGMFYGDR